jgi:hypothetical protein
MNEVALFTAALRAAVPAQPDPGMRSTISPRLAAAARSSTIEAETRTSRPAEGLRSGRPRSRRALVAVAAAVAVIPLLLAGLAIAGVTVPAPARHAFHSVGITLPNQPPDHGGTAPVGEKARGPSGQGGGDEVSGGAGAKSTGNGGNSATAQEHARIQREKAEGKANGRGQGRAVGLNGTTPPGQAKTPPGHQKTPAGQTKVPPGQEKTPPGQAKTPPGQAKTPPGQAESSPTGQAKIPPGHSK